MGLIDFRHVSHGKVAIVLRVNGMNLRRLRESARGQTLQL